jgi:Zn-dependent protease
LSLVDLIPLGPLDGRRVFGALSRRQRIACLCATVMLALLSRSLLVTPLCAALAWSATRPAPRSQDRRIAAVFVALVATGLLLV